jgi:hypothetical protein
VYVFMRASQSKDQKTSRSPALEGVVLHEHDSYASKIAAVVDDQQHADVKPDVLVKVGDHDPSKQTVDFSRSRPEGEILDEGELLDKLSSVPGGSKMSAVDEDQHADVKPDGLDVKGRKEDLLARAVANPNGHHDPSNKTVEEGFSPRPLGEEDEGEIDKLSCL